MVGAQQQHSLGYRRQDNRHRDSLQSEWKANILRERSRYLNATMGDPLTYEH
jgi:hypothetical protein